MKILIVEDNQYLLNTYKQILGPSYEIITAQSDVEAFDQFFAYFPCLILMDYNLGPHSLTGDVICRQIMDLAPETKVICISADPPEYDARNRFYAVLTKPVDAKKLKEVVEKALED